MFTTFVEPTMSVIPIGRQGENLARAIHFDLSDMINEFGQGTATLVHIRSKDTAPYICKTTVVGDRLVWAINDTDTAFAGNGRCELRWTVGNVLAKSIIYTTKTEPSITADEKVPDPYRSWYESLLDDINQYIIASDQIADNTANIEANTEDLQILTGRVDEMSTLPEGSTTGDAELADGRVGYDGTRYTNIGTAIRAQITALKSKADTLETRLKSGALEDAELHLGFYLDEDGDLCQVD